MQLGVVDFQDFPRPGSLLYLYWCSDQGPIVLDSVQAQKRESPCPQRTASLKTVDHNLKWGFCSLISHVPILKLRQDAVYYNTCNIWLVRGAVRPASSVLKGVWLSVFLEKATAVIEAGLALFPFKGLLFYFLPAGKLICQSLWGPLFRSNPVAISHCSLKGKEGSWSL